MNENQEYTQEKVASQHPAIFPVALSGFTLAVLAGVAAALAGFGTRWGWWYFRTGFVILRWAAYGGIAAAVISLLGSILNRRGVLRRGFILSILGFLLGLILFAVPLYWWWTAQHVPPIHDITTDTENPPHFVSILPLRKNAPNPAEYGGSEIAAKQHAAYSDLGPAILSVSPNQALNRALVTARRMGWKVVDTNVAEGRIEATDTTFWFGFKDDVVIRIAPSDHRSRVDVRSVSRVGRSDLGTNARRIQKYLKALTQTE